MNLKKSLHTFSRKNKPKFRSDVNLRLKIRDSILSTREQIHNYDPMQSRMLTPSERSQLELHKKVTGRTYVQDELIQNNKDIIYQSNKLEESKINRKKGLVGKLRWIFAGKEARNKIKRRKI
jgi:hypothetical protein